MKSCIMRWDLTKIIMCNVLTQIKTNEDKRKSEKKLFS